MVLLATSVFVIRMIVIAMLSLVVLSSSTLLLRSCFFLIDALLRFLNLNLGFTSAIVVVFKAIDISTIIGRRVLRSCNIL